MTIAIRLQGYLIGLNEEGLIDKMRHDRMNDIDDLVFLSGRDINAGDTLPVSIHIIRRNDRDDPIEISIATIWVVDILDVMAVIGHVCIVSFSLISRICAVHTNRRTAYPSPLIVVWFPHEDRG